MSVDLRVASKAFILRYLEESQKEKVDNSKLYAGSPMYYYCKGCNITTEILPETHTCVPKTWCDPCVVIRDSGILQSLQQIANDFLAKNNQNPTPEEFDVACVDLFKKIELI